METQEKTNTNGKATVVITYNSVREYPAGVYQGKNGPVVVHSQDNTSTWEDLAESKLGQVLHGIYDRVNPEDVKQVYLYVGLYAKQGALRAARNLAGEGNNLTIVACDCDAEEKSRVARSLNAPIIWSECGGRNTLARLVKESLN